MIYFTSTAIRERKTLFTAGDQRRDGKGNIKLDQLQVLSVSLSHSQQEGLRFEGGPDPLSVTTGPQCLGEIE